MGYFRPSLTGRINHARVIARLFAEVRTDVSTFMGADSTYLFYGVRYHVTDLSEIQSLQTGEHILVKAAKKAGLQTLWGNFDLEGGEYYLLYVGHELGVLGFEGTSDLEISDTKLAQIQIETRRKLSGAGFSLVPALFAQFEPDV